MQASTASNVLPTNQTPPRPETASPRVRLFCLAGWRGLGRLLPGAATFFLSDVGFGQGAPLDNPTIVIPNVGDIATIYAYALLDPDQVLINVGLDFISADPAIAEAVAMD